MEGHSQLSIDNKSLYLLLYVRHGQREDENLTEKLPDPKITDEGANQAKVTGTYLKFLFMQNFIEQVIIECSPFLRCLQTASAIA